MKIGTEQGTDSPTYVRDRSPISCKKNARQLPNKSIFDPLDVVKASCQNGTVKFYVNEMRIYLTKKTSIMMLMTKQSDVIRQSFLMEAKVAHTSNSKNSKECTSYVFWVQIRKG